MSIIVIRHGKVDMRWPRWCNAEEFGNACRLYDEADIMPIHAETKEHVTGKVYISTQGRSLKTAEALLGAREYTQMSGLCEVPLRSFARLRFRLPLWVWNVAGRLQWYFGSERQEESRSDTIRRAGAVIEQIEKEEECVVVTHGFFMKTFLGQLKKAGYALEGDRAFGFDNLHMVRAEKR